MKRADGIKFGTKDIVVHDEDINDMIEDDKELMIELANQEKKEKLIKEKKREE